MENDGPHPGEGRVIRQLEPLGLICGGKGTPLGQTWIDLTASNQVFYGLNGAGKTTLLEELELALLGRAGGGRILVRLPIRAATTVPLRHALSKMFTHADWLSAEEAHETFVEAQREALARDFQARRKLIGPVEVEGSEFDTLDWTKFIGELAASNLWLFTPTGSDRQRWSASPILLAGRSSKWSDHLRELALIYEHDHGPIPGDFELHLLWDEWSSPPEQGDAPMGIEGKLLQRVVEVEAGDPWWPFGQVVTDHVVDLSVLTRQHLAKHPVSSHHGIWEYRASLDRSELERRAGDVQARANFMLTDLLSDAPALHLDIGGNGKWFAGRSCTWSASRFEGDARIALDRLSSAEFRWARVAIKLALADELNASWDRAFDKDEEEFAKRFREGLSNRSSIEGSATTWLLLDEPERGLHRTAETQMARAVGRRSKSGVRSVSTTHSPDLLDRGFGDVSYVRRRSHDRSGAVLSMREFEGARGDLGLNPSDMLRRTRGIALVEGEHDLQILTGMIGPDLFRLGVEILPLRGGKQLQTATKARFLFDFTDAVLFPILDDLLLAPVTEMWNQHVFSARTAPLSKVAEELRSELRALSGKGGEFLEEFLSTSITDGRADRVYPLGIPQTDILECLPVQALVPEARSWSELREAARKGNGGVDPSETKFKTFLERNRKADLSAEHLHRLAKTSPVHLDVEALLAAINSRLST